MNNEKTNQKIKLSNNSSFVILIFVISKFQNIRRFTFRRSKFWPPPVWPYLWSSVKMPIIVHDSIEKYGNHRHFCQFTPSKNDGYCTSLIVTELDYRNTVTLSEPRANESSKNNCTVRLFLSIHLHYQSKVPTVPGQTVQNS